MSKNVKNRKVKRMKIKQTNSGKYSLTPHKNSTDPYSLPVSKGDLHELKDALVWPPEITRNVYGKIMQDILKQQRDLLTSSTSLTPQEIIYKSIDLSGQFYTANKKFFDEETNKAQPQQAPAIADLQPQAAIKTTPVAIQKTILESKKKKLDAKRKFLKGEQKEEDIIKKLKKSYQEKKKHTQSFYKQLRLSGRIK